MKAVEIPDGEGDELSERIVAYMICKGCGRCTCDDSTSVDICGIRYCGACKSAFSFCGPPPQALQ